MSSSTSQTCGTSDRVIRPLPTRRRNGDPTVANIPLPAPALPLPSYLPSVYNEPALSHHATSVFNGGRGAQCQLIPRPLPEHDAALQVLREENPLLEDEQLHMLFWKIEKLKAAHTTTSTQAPHQTHATSGLAGGVTLQREYVCVQFNTAAEMIATYDELISYELTDPQYSSTGLILEVTATEGFGLRGWVESVMMAGVLIDTGLT